MRKIIVKPTAQKSILEVADWLAKEYYLDTGFKFIDNVGTILESYATLNHIIYPLCKNKRLAKRKFSCFVFNKKWIVAFKYTKTTFTVYEFIWGAKLK